MRGSWKLNSSVTILKQWHAATLSEGMEGFCLGGEGYVLKDRCGQVHDSHPISASLHHAGFGGLDPFSYLFSRVLWFPSYLKRLELDS